MATAAAITLIGLVVAGSSVLAQVVGSSSESPEAIERTIPVHQTQSVDGIDVTLDHLELLHSGMYVYYSIDSGIAEGDALAAPDATYPDGTVVAGLNRPNLTSDLRRAMFPLPATEATSVVFRMNSVSQAGDSLSLRVSLGELLDGADITSPQIKRIPVDTEAIIGGETFRIADVEVGQGLFTVTVSNTTPNGTVEFAGNPPQVVLKDSEGAIHSLRSAGVGFRKDESGTISAGSNTFTFTGIDLKTVRNFELVSQVSGSIDQGPWLFKVQLH